MPIVIADAPTRASFEGSTEPVEITTPEGRTLGVFTPVRFPITPYWREELERRRAEYRRTGIAYTTEEVFARLAKLDEAKS